MTFYNCGASFDGKRVPSKKRLRELLKDSPVDVYFDGTSLFDSVQGYRGNEVPDGLKLTVVLPDPFKDRRYYATVEKKPDGSLRVL